jgi:hypothetical protein
MRIRLDESILRISSLLETSVRVSRQNPRLWLVAAPGKPKTEFCQDSRFIVHPLSRLIDLNCSMSASAVDVDKLLFCTNGR